MFIQVQTNFTQNFIFFRMYVSIVKNGNDVQKGDVNFSDL